MNNVVILSTAYLAPVQYYSKIASNDEVFIEKFENYSKQSYRNRCIILAANGPLSLVVPVKKNNSLKTIISDIQIDYTLNWQKIHLKSIESAYNSSPFYQYYINEFLPIYLKRDSFLIDFNSNLQEVILKLLKIKKNIKYTAEFLKSYEDKTKDFRFSITPKRTTTDNDFLSLEYYQVFREKFGFIQSLSIIDLLFNMGNDSGKYLAGERV